MDWIYFNEESTITNFEEHAFKSICELSAFVYTNTIILLKTCVDTLNLFHHILIVLNPEKAPLLCKKQKIQLLFLSTYIEAHTHTLNNVQRQIPYAPSSFPFTNSIPQINLMLTGHDSEYLQ